MIKGRTNNLLICILNLCIPTMTMKRRWNHNKYKPLFKRIIVTTTTTMTSAQRRALKTTRQRTLVCNKGQNVPDFGSNDNSVHKQSLPFWKKTEIECNMIATRCRQALATKTMIKEQDCVTVSIVAAFSNFSPACATYVLTYVNLVDAEKGRRNKRTIFEFKFPDFEIQNIIAQRVYVINNIISTLFIS